LRSSRRSAKAQTLREFDLIARLCVDLPRSRNVILGPGDDCAILVGSRQKQLVTIDSMVEGVHFRLEWGTPESLGARSLTVNLSDIAAMGGVPRACVINLGIRAGLDQKFFERLYSGLRGEAASARVEIAGGNITRSNQFTITIALIGEARAALMQRDSAHPGDGIYVTGTIGDAAMGLRILQDEGKARGRERRYLIDRFLNPTARIEAGLKLAKLRPTPSAIDISDGLWQDLEHILERSHVGAEIDAATIPLSPAYRSVAGNDWRTALTGGDDYELLFCTSPQYSSAALTRKLGITVHQIGRIIKGDQAFISMDGKRIEAGELSGWDQLKGRRD
jgi:thiamine-monophosphate kinase